MSTTKGKIILFIFPLRLSKVATILIFIFFFLCPALPAIKARLGQRKPVLIFYQIFDILFLLRQIFDIFTRE